MDQKDKIVPQSAHIFFISGEEQQIVHNTEELIAQQEKLIIMEESKKEEDKVPHSVMIIGSNNIMGRNIFLVNTNAQEQDLKALVEALPPEMMDTLMKAAGMVIESRANTNGS